MTRPAETAAILTRLFALPRERRAEVLAGLDPRQRRELTGRWWLWAHEGQLWPGGAWRIWLIRAGRGFGKTRAGSEWVLQMAREMPGARVALVGATLEDARKVMVEGPSGLLTCARADEPLDWRRANGELGLPNGGRAYLYSAEAPEKLRGPEHGFAWCDELAKWRHGTGTAAWDNLLLGLRSGERPRVLVTTTPRPTELMQRLMTTPGLAETHGRTRDNPHLPPSFVEAMLADYGGTRLGRQELDGELLGEAEGALWTRALLDACRVAAAPARLARVVVGVDPPATSHGDACGIVAVARGEDGDAYVIEDATVTRASPERWAQAVAACAARTGADRVVAERNQGGDMVRSVLEAAERALPLRLVHASRGKCARAEPVATLYEAGRVHHVGCHPALEDEMCGLMAGGDYRGPGRSPDRADALVWAMTELMLRRKGAAAVRTI